LSQHDLEYLMAFVQERTATGFNGAAAGEFIGDYGWSFSNIPVAETRFRARAEAAPGDWPWFTLVDGKHNLDSSLEGLRGTLSALRSRG
jgi:hypothetical protein